MEGGAQGEVARVPCRDGVGGHVSPMGQGLQLTCFSAHSPHHGRHRGHCWPVHPVVLWRLLHVSSHHRPRGVGGAARGSASGLRIEMPLPLGVQHSTVCRVLLPSLGPLHSQQDRSATVVEAKAQGSDLIWCLAGVGTVSTPRGPLCTLLSAALLAGSPRLSDPQDRHGGGRVQDGWARPVESHLPFPQCGSGQQGPGSLQQRARCGPQAERGLP